MTDTPAAASNIGDTTMEARPLGLLLALGGAIALLAGVAFLAVAAIKLPGRIKPDEADGFLWLSCAFGLLCIFIAISILLSRKPFDGYILARNPTPAKNTFNWMWKPLLLGKFDRSSPTLFSRPIGLPFLGFCLGCGVTSFFAHLYLQPILELFRSGNPSVFAASQAPAVPSDKGPYATYFFRAGGAGRSDFISAQYRSFTTGNNSYEAYQATARSQFQSIGATTAYVEVVGFADASGSAAENQRLSGYRAVAVRDMLIGAGIPAAIISTRGAGIRGKLCLKEGLDKPQRRDCLGQDRRVDVYYYKAPKLISDMH